MTGYMLDLLLRSLIAGLFGFAILAVLRKKPAAVQHMIAVAVILAILALPVAKQLVPTQRLALLPQVVDSVPTGHVIEPGMLASARHRAPSPPAAMSRAIHLDPWLIIWLLGLGLVVARYGAGWLTIRRWVKTGEPVRIGSGSARYIVSDAVQVPMTAWAGRHIVLLPLDWAGWPEARKNSVLLHEMAHIQRGDWFTQLAGRLACALFWPNPLLWAVSSRCRSLAERAADDRVLACGVDPAQYAQDLLEIARNVKATLPELSVSMVHGSDVARRIEMVIGKQTQRGSANCATLLLSGIALLGLALPVACTTLVRQATPAIPLKGKGVDSFQYAQIMVSTKLVSTGTSLDSVGLAATVPHSLPPGASKGAAIPPSLFELSDSAYKTLSDLLTEKKLLISTPVVRTISNQKATIETSMNGAIKERIEVTPRLNVDGTLTVAMTLSIGGDRAIDTESVVYRVKNGRPMVIAKQSKQGKLTDLVAVVTVKVIDPNDRP